MRMYFVVFCFLLQSTDATVEDILMQMKDKAILSKKLLTPFVDRLVRHYTKKHEQIVFLPRHLDTDMSVVSKTTASMLLRTAECGMQNHSAGVTIIPGKLPFKEILTKIISWSASTKFFVILGRRRHTDNFYVGNAMFQSSDLTEIITAQEIAEDFHGMIERNTDIIAHTHTNLKHVLKEFWALRIVNVVVLIPQKTKIYIYSYFPFTARNCGDFVKPLLVNIWHSDTEEFHKRVHLFPDKTRKMHGCPLNVSLVHSPPGVMYGTHDIEGIEGLMLVLVFKALNVTPVVHYITELDGNTSTTAMSHVLHDLSLGDSDFAAGLLIPTVMHAHVVEDINLSLTVCLTWAVPNRAKKQGYIAAVAKAFTPLVWLLSISTLLLSGLILWVLSRLEARKHTSLELFVFKLVTVSIGKYTPFPKPTPARVFFMSYVWFSLVIGAAFQARLGSFNIIPEPPSQLETTYDVIHSGLKLSTSPSTANIFKSQLPLQRDGEPIDVEPMDIEDALMMVGNERRTAFVGLRLTMKYFTRLVHPQLRFKIHLQDTCVVQYPTFLALRRNSPFTIGVSQLVSRLIEGGFQDHLSQKYLVEMQRSGASWNRKNMRKTKKSSRDGALAKGAIIIWAGGMVVGCTAFLCEVIIYRLCRRHDAKMTVTGN